MHDNDNFCLFVYTHTTHDSSALYESLLSIYQDFVFIAVVVAVVVSKDCFVCFIMVHLKNEINVARYLSK